MSFFSLC